MKIASHLFLLICASFLFACERSPADRITGVLNQCAAVSSRATAYNGSPGAQAMFVAAEMQKVDVTNCPADFRMAYQAHIFAWQQSALALANNNPASAFIEGLAAGALDQPEIVGKANQQAAEAGKQINNTYFQLTQIAARYGARIPTSVVGQ